MAKSSTISPMASTCTPGIGSPPGRITTPATVPPADQGDVDVEDGSADDPTTGDTNVGTNPYDDGGSTLIV